MHGATIKIINDCSSLDLAVT